MKSLRRNVALMSVIALLSLSACASSDPVVTESPSATMTTAPTSEPATPSDDAVTQADLSRTMPDAFAQKKPANDIGEFSAPTSQPAEATVQREGAALEWQRSVDSQASSYWSSDWCHYYQDANGVTYGETCVRALADATGAKVPDWYVIYRYDPTQVGNLGPAILEMHTGLPGYTTYRDLTDPMFQTVAWVAFPTHMHPLTQDHFWAAISNNNGQLTWYTLAQILEMGQVGGNGQSNGKLAPAWDPSITVWTYPMLSGINATLQQIPSFIP